MTPRICIIVAMDKNRVIGKNDTLPWKLPADLAYFKEVTMGHLIVMGRKTHEAIGKFLPGRINVVVTRQANYVPRDPRCFVVQSIPDAIKLAKKTDEIFFIGGSEIYEQAIKEAELLYITEINATFEGDKKFPEIDDKLWSLLYVQAGKQDEQNPYHFMHILLHRSYTSTK